MNDLDKFFSNFTLRFSGKKPFDTKEYLYADYFELMALFNNKNIITKGEVLDRLKDEGIITQVENQDNQAEENDENEAFVRNIFLLIAQRNISFNTDYPFNYSNECISLKDDLNTKQKLYIHLLLSSNLYLFPKVFESYLTTEFELLSEEALKNYLPDFAIIKSFGENSEFKGYTKNKIKQLAKLMNIDSQDPFLETIADKGTKDLGLDIVGWLPFEDTIGNYLSIFVQCACGKDWNKKLSETKRYNRLLKSYLSDFKHSLFIPYSLINYNNSTFFEHHEFGEPILLFERKRILSLIKDENIFSRLNTTEFIDRCIVYEEDIV